MKKKIYTIVLLCSLILSLAACGTQQIEENEVIKVGGLRGPTAMGMLKLMEDNDGDYDFELSAEAAAFIPSLMNGEIDIAAVPANLAAVVYNNSDGAVKLAAVNTVNVLYIVERGDKIGTINDLQGRKLYATGEGAVPEFILRYILKENGLDKENAPQIQWCSDTAEALSYIAADENAAAMLPQPFVTAAKAKVGDLRTAIDLNDEFKRLSGSDIVTGVVAVRAEFIEKHPDAFTRFMEDYKESVGYVLSHNDEAAELCEKYGIVNKAVAGKALPYCGITFITGEEMKTTAEKYLEILYASDPKFIGGSVPTDDFYYG